MRQQSLVALCRARLAGTRGGRFGRVFATIVTGGFAAVAVNLRVNHRPDASLSGLTLGAAPWITLVSGGALAFAAAEDRAAADRREGIEALVAARGFSPASLEAARVLAAMSAVATAIGAPLALLALLTALLAGRAAAVIHGAGVGLGALGFALVAGVTRWEARAPCVGASGGAGAAGSSSR